MNHVDLIGTPFVWGGRGPDGYDCWGLVRECYLRSGVTPPEYTTPDDMAARIAAILSGVAEWDPAEQGEGAMVLFELPMGMRHVGYCLGGDRFVHCWERSGGVCVERLSVWKRWTQGFYRPVGRGKISHS